MDICQKKKKLWEHIIAIQTFQIKIFYFTLDGLVFFLLTH